MARKDYQNLLDTKHLQTDLKKRSLRSGAVTLTSQGLSFVIQLGSTMILARILTPEDYGMMAMVVAITGFASLFMNLGLSTAVIQRAEITHEQVSTLFWINAGLGTVVMLLVACLSPVVAWFYNTPELKWVVLALSSNFFINGLAVQHQALLNRQMRFLAIAGIQVGGMLTGIGVAIGLALNGFSYWALVFNSLTVSVFSVTGSWFASGWRPSMPRYNSAVGEMIRFGSDIVGFNVVNYFSRNLDNVLIGRYHGGAALGLYDKAYQLLMMPITNLRDPLNRVAMPVLSKLQNDPVQYRNYYMKFLSILSFVAFPVIVFLFVFSDMVINFILGPKWLESSEIFKILAFGSLIQVVGSTRGMVLLSSGKSRRYLILGTIGAIFTCVSFVIGIPWGAKGVALSYVIGSYIKELPFMFFSFKGTHVSVLDYFRSIGKNFIGSIFMGLACLFLIDEIFLYSEIVTLLIFLFVSLVFYLFINVILSKGTNDIKMFIEYGSLAFGKKS